MLEPDPAARGSTGPNQVLNVIYTSERLQSRLVLDELWMYPVIAASEAGAAIGQAFFPDSPPFPLVENYIEGPSVGDYAVWLTTDPALSTVGPEDEEAAQALQLIMHGVVFMQGNDAASVAVIGPRDGLEQADLVPLVLRVAARLAGTSEPLPPDPAVPTGACGPMAPAE
jgi:hypothetical protein